MMKRLVLFAICAALVCMVGSLPARAGSISSSAAFVEACPVCSLNGGGSAVDMMKVFIQPISGGVTFGTPGLNVMDISWGPSGWVENDPNLLYSTASGAPMSTFVYQLNFNIDNTINPSTAAFNVDVYYFQMGTIIDSAVLTYNGPISFDTTENNFGVSYPSEVDTNRMYASENQVPEPASLLLLGTGLGALGLAAWRRKK